MSCCSTYPATLPDGDQQEGGEKGEFPKVVELDNRRYTVGIHILTLGQNTPK